MKKIYIIIIILLTSILGANAQLYIDGYTSLNTLTIHNEYNFFGNLGFGYNNKKIKIGVEFGLNAGIPYKKQVIPGTGSVTFIDYVEGETYNTSKGSSKKIISVNGNIYSNKGILTFDQFIFGINTEWFIIRTFTEKLKWFDIGVFSGIGFGYYHTYYSVKYFQPYMKVGLELDFNIKNITFFINGDIRYFSALNNIEKQSTEYHSYIQQCIGFGIRYTIPIIAKSKKEKDYSDKANIINNIIINNCNNEKQLDTVVINDTILINNEIMLPTTIFFANDKYNIKKTEYHKLNKAINYINSHNSKVKLIGMASNAGTCEYNKELSLNRCLSVLKYLVKHGVPNKNIEIEPIGKMEAEKYEDALDRCVIIIFE